MQSPARTRLLASLAVATLAASGCATDEAPAEDVGDVGRLGVALSLPPDDVDVAAVLFEVNDADGAVQSAIVSLPTGAAGDGGASRRTAPRTRRLSGPEEFRGYQLETPRGRRSSPQTFADAHCQIEASHEVA